MTLKVEGVVTFTPSEKGSVPLHATVVELFDPSQHKHQFGFAGEVFIGDYKDYIELADMVKAGLVPVRTLENRLWLFFEEEVTSHD